MKTSLLRNGIKDIRTSAAVGAVTDGIISLVVSGDTAIREYFNRKSTLNDCAFHIFKETVVGVAKGGTIGAIVCGPEVAGQIAVNTGFSSVGSVLKSGGKMVGPALMVGMVGYSACNILKLYNDGKITSADADKGLLQLTMSSLLSTGGMIAAGALVGGPIGIAIGAGITIAVTIGDYYLGDKISSLIIKDDHKGTIVLLKKHEDAMLDAVVTAAYKLLDLTKHATEDELKQNIKAARLKYHPDKGGERDTQCSRGGNQCN
ncbi:DNAJA2 [Mytilus edulis]|uniref:DNAJA2 n=1 Tax=Mytilus edulis TaxID=6550 RepID=A0A8S3T6Z9_MYTED|nr:DNAJA2 [Mytilus edulis]